MTLQFIFDTTNENAHKNLIRYYEQTAKAFFAHLY